MERVRELLVHGLSDGAISARTGIPANTVRRWRLGRTRAFGPRFSAHDWRPPDEPAYAYLLGLYLGDGCLSELRRRVVLRIALDAAYEDIVWECAFAAKIVMPPRAVTVDRHAGTVAYVQSCGRRWLDAFPQHGPGRKHERPIVLTAWQREVVDCFPRELLRGLIHSDGCRTVNRFTTKLPSGRTAEYAYARYFFSNLSADIRGLFCDACDALGIRWTQSNPRNISIAHRPSVARLDAFVGPKR